MSLTEGQRLKPDQFVDDHGDRAKKFPPDGLEGYSNLYINGVMQEGALYQVSPREIRLQSVGQTVLAGTPIILESVHFTVMTRRKTVKSTREIGLRIRRRRK